MADEELKFARGDLASVMAAHPHVAEWVRDFEARYGSRPTYYGPLDRDAKKQRPLNLIYITKEPIFVHIYEPSDDEDDAGQILWIGLEPMVMRGSCAQRGTSLCHGHGLARFAAATPRIKHRVECARATQEA